MIKRLLAAVFAVAILATTISATAEAGGYRWRTMGPIKIRHQRVYTAGADLPQGYVFDPGLGATAYHIDSAAAYIPGGALGIDTTVVFTMPSDWVIPAVGDSMPVLAITVDIVGGTLASGDTIYAVFEPGNDAIGYCSSTAFPFATQHAVVGLASGGTQRILNNFATKVYSTNTNTQTVAQPYSWVYVPGAFLGEGRVRIWGDQSGGASANKLFQVSISYPAADALAGIGSP